MYEFVEVQIEHGEKQVFPLLKTCFDEETFSELQQVEEKIESTKHTRKKTPHPNASCSPYSEQISYNCQYLHPPHPHKGEREKIRLTRVL